MNAAKQWKMYLAGEWRGSDRPLEVRFPYDERLVATVPLASAAELTEAIEQAHAALPAGRELPSHARARVLQSVSEGIAQRRDEFARTLTLENGKAIKDAQGEVARAITTFALGAEEAKRLPGEVLDLDLAAGQEHRVGIVRRFVRGVVGGITPFNFPLNLVAHKVAPAIACGAPIVLKPASQTPLSALLLAEQIDQAGLPHGMLSVLPCRGADASPLVEDPRVKVLTFTGSPAVGWGLRARAPKKQVVLELGGNAGVIVHHDADLEYAVARIVLGGYALAGQSCISVQRIYVQQEIYDAFLKQFSVRVAALRVGDPFDPMTDVGTMVDQAAAERTEQWVAEAKSAGAKVLVGGSRRGRSFEPTVLVEVPPQAKVCRQEVFAPVTVVFPYQDFDQALAAVNDSDYGLQAGVFTSDLLRVERAYRELEVGGVIVGDIPTFRADHMPYGGAKDSGIGREGVRYAIEDYTERKILVLNLR
jgi:glyceraldehyde-3-phosphate dehydrogenase (NADP+)